MMASLNDFLQSPNTMLALRMLSAAGPQAQPASFGQRLYSAVQGQQQSDIANQLTLAKMASLYQKKPTKETLPDRLKVLARKIAIGKATKEEKYEYDLLRSASGTSLVTNPVFRNIAEGKNLKDAKLSKAEKTWIKNAQMKNPKFSRAQIIEEGRKRGYIR